MPLKHGSTSRAIRAPLPTLEVALQSAIAALEEWQLLSSALDDPVLIDTTGLNPERDLPILRRQLASLATAKGENEALVRIEKQNESALALATPQEPPNESENSKSNNLYRPTTGLLGTGP